jgi:hypothetical protein
MDEKMTDNVIKLSKFLADKTHEALVKICRDSLEVNYLPGSLFQFYPSYIKFTKHHVYIKSEAGETIIIPQPDFSGYWEKAQKLHDEYQRGACV